MRGLQPSADLDGMECAASLRPSADLEGLNLEMRSLRTLKGWSRDAQSAALEGLK